MHNLNGVKKLHSSFLFYDYILTQYEEWQEAAAEKLHSENLFYFCSSIEQECEVKRRRNANSWHQNDLQSTIPLDMTKKVKMR